MRADRRIQYSVERIDDFPVGSQGGGRRHLVDGFVVAANVGLMLWFLYVLGTALVEGQDSRLLQRLRTGMSFRKFSIGRRSSDSQGSRNALNQFNGVVTNKAIAGKVVELGSSLKVHQREQGEKRQSLEDSAGSTGHKHSGMDNHWTRHLSV